MEVSAMFKYVLISLAAAMAVRTNPVVAAAHFAVAVTGQAVAEGRGNGVGFPPLDKTWTRWGQDSEACAQVLANSRLTKPVSFSAEGKGFEPSTPCGASDFELAGLAV
jgi:hypothetical protein